MAGFPAGRQRQTKRGPILRQPARLAISRPSRAVGGIVERPQSTQHGHSKCRAPMAENRSAGCAKMADEHFSAGCPEAGATEQQQTIANRRCARGYHLPRRISIQISNNKNSGEETTKAMAIKSIALDANRTNGVSFCSTTALVFRCMKKPKSRAPKISPPKPYPRQRPIVAPSIIRCSKLAVFQILRATKTTSSKIPMQLTIIRATYVAIRSLSRGPFGFWSIFKDTSPELVSDWPRFSSARVFCRSESHFSAPRGTASWVGREFGRWRPQQFFWPCRRCDGGSG